MKYLILFILLITSNKIFSQTREYKNFSKFFSGKDTLVPIRPLNLRNSYYRNNIDTNLVKTIVYEKFNDFRSDYNVNDCIKSKKLHESAQCWAYNIMNIGIQHEAGDFAECCASISTIRFTCIYPEDGDINQIVARYVLDSFWGSTAHMNTLTTQRYQNVGIGLTFSPQRIYIVIRLTQ